MSNLHKETAAHVGSGLLINYPLNLLGLYICLNVLNLTNTMVISGAITAFLTVTAYCRVYTLRRYFQKY